MKSQQHEWTVSRKRKSNGDMKLLLRRSKRARLELESLKSLSAATLREERETNQRVEEELKSANETLKNLEDERQPNAEFESVIAARARLFEQILRPWPE